ncbi:cysteine rich repeat-containing protein [Rhodopseudomonas telluris]|uniref:Cysteine rich repeat-containing protein n=1 Tax=Rhodopseudomonas telluris TaxID=644215 RepID=A0ABV6EV65_9BRAD
MRSLMSKSVRRRPVLFYTHDAMVRAALVAALVIAALAVSLSMASAQDRDASRGAAREACKPDYQKFCSTVTPGGGRIKKCLADNFASLSDACKQVVGSAK